MPDSPNEGLANLLARLLADDDSQSENAARGALMILTGIQAFLDSGGQYRTVELAWEPTLVARQFEKAYGAEAWKKAAEMSGAALALDDRRGAEIYERVALMLQPPPQVNSNVDNPS